MTLAYSVYDVRDLFTYNNMLWGEFYIFDPCSEEHSGTFYAKVTTDPWLGLGIHPTEPGGLVICGTRLYDTDTVTYKKVYNKYTAYPIAWISNYLYLEVTDSSTILKSCDNKINIDLSQHISNTYVVALYEGDI